MPGKVKVKILAGKNLPVMDRSRDTTDAYVEIKLGGTTYKTDVCKKSLNPQWNTDWYRFEVDDLELQDEPLQIRLMDYDTYSANDSIGKVYLNLNPLLLPSGSLLPRFGLTGDSSNSGEHVTNSVMSGWLPVYDTMHGIRGEVNVIVKVELFSDFNRFRQSSCGVHFFCSSVVPHGYYVQMINGFVEELIVNNDPEYQWIDKIRTPRASNEARQTLFFKLSCELQRKVGVKTIELGGNAVIGYSQCFDLERECGVVVRGTGTAVTLIKLKHQPTINPLDSNEENASSPVSETIRHGHGHQRTESVGAKGLHSPARFHPIPYMHRRSSDSDLSITPKGNSLTGSDKSCGLPSGYFSRLGPLLKSIGPQENFEMLEYPFLTISSFPPGLVIYLGGVVSARSVKLLGRAANHEEPESRDIWWTEIRMEIRSHARSLGCNAVIGYSESSSICDEVCILSASGTAAVVGIQYTGEISDGISGIPFISKPYYNNKEATASLDRSDFDKDKTSQRLDHTLFTSSNVTTKPLSESPENEIPTPYTSTPSACTLCHVGYVAGSVPLRTVTSKCRVCRMGKVPDVLLATVEMPDGMPTVGRGCFVQAYVCRPLKDSRGESYAKDLSDVLPFVEYELHRKLLNKLKIQGMNAVFGLRVRITIGAKTLIGIVTGTGVFLLALPPPPLPKLVSDSPTDERKLAEMQKLLFDTVKLNKEIYQLKINDDIQGIQTSPDEVFEDDHPQLNLFFDNRECCVLEVDDLEDMEVRNLITESRPPDGFHVVNTESVPGLDELEIVKNLQMFTQIWRAKLQHPFNLGIHVQKLLQSVYFKLRRMIPCALCNLKFRIDLPESDEIQLSVLGMALELGVPDKSKPKQKSVLKDLKKSEDDMIFNLEDDHMESSTSQSNSGHLSVQTAKCRGRSPQRLQAINFKKVLHRERHGVDITPLSFIPGGKIERYLGNLNFFFIRETTSLREEGGLSGFIHSFIMEVLAIIRAHMVALGGNAMVAYYMTECVLSHSLHRNQGQCLINVGGDVVFVSYFSEE